MKLVKMLSHRIHVEPKMYTAAVLHKPSQIIIEERVEPQLEGNEALIKVNYAGVCGTDIAIFSGEYTVPLPLVLGHEFTGEVSAVGSEVSSDLIGKRVTAEINNTCIAYKRKELCPACRRNLPNHCTQRTVVGIISHDGAFAQLVKVPVGSVHELPANISSQEGVFVEPLAAAIQTFEVTKIKTGNTVVVLGIGRLGILICAAASLMGAKTIAVSRSTDKLQRAIKYGATETIDASKNDVIQYIKMITDGLGADVVVECTGSSVGINTAINLVRPRGTIALKTTCGIPADNIDTTKLVVDEIRIQGSRCGPFDKAIDLLQAGKISVAPLIEDIYPLQDVVQAIESAKQASKILIHAN
jgi:alcohol dehydrogenase